MATASDDWPEKSRELRELLARTGLGDRAAFAELYRRTSAHLFGVVLRIARDRSQAEDVLQEAYVNVWRAASGFDAAKAQPLTWLTSIARNRAIDSLRRAQAQPRLQTPAALDPDDGDDALERVADDGPGPLELLSQAAEARALGDCMAQLTPVQRQSMALAFYDGLSHSEVAERLRQPLGTVKSWLRRGLLALKACLERAVERDDRRGEAQGASS